MRRFICLISFLCLGLGLQYMMAQPPARRAQQQEKKETAPSLSVRAQSQYTGQVPVPEEVVWKREIYRKLDLNKAENSALYFPVEPIGNRMNLFNLIFKMLAEGKVNAYEYRLDGTENLTADNRIKLVDVLDRFHIYYEEKVDRRDTTYVVDNSDIPSAEVMSYLIKEEWYFDQRTSVYNSRIVAICPVLHRAGDFSMEVSNYPMFWLNYNEISPYLNQMPIMTSDHNNATNVTMNDYFTARQFNGDIYKTTNMLNRSLQQYCETDSAMQAEQQRIEGQLETFRRNLWETGRSEMKAEQAAALAKAAGEEEGENPEEAGSTTGEEPVVEKSKSTAKAPVVINNSKNSKRVGRDKAATSSSKKAKASKQVKKESSSKSSKSSSGARVSVRRERR